VLRLLALNYRQLVVLPRLLCSPIPKHGHQTGRVLRLRDFRGVEPGIARVGVVGNERRSIAGDEVAQQKSVGVKFHGEGE